MDSYTNVVIKPKSLERNLISNIKNIELDDLPSVKDSKSSYSKIRMNLGLKTSYGDILSGKDSISKFKEGSGRSILGLSMPPADSSGIAELCAWKDRCQDDCVGVGGNNKFGLAYLGKLSRLKLLIENPKEWLTILVDSLDKVSDKYGQKNVGVRMNVYSDIRWENILPEWFWDRYSEIIFYDYTKHPINSRPKENFPQNYFLTYSVSGRSTDEEILKQINAGRSIALVVETLGGIDRRTGNKRPLPIKTAKNIVDGDFNDRRYLDKPGSIVMLRRKNGLPLSNSLVIDNVRLNTIKELINS